MDIDYIKQLNTCSLTEYLLTENFTSEAHILESRDIDGDKFLSFTELDLAQWRFNSYQKTLILSCRNKILRKSLVSKPLPSKPNPRKEKFEQNKFLTNFPNDEKQEQNSKTLPAQSKEISANQNDDSDYEVPRASPKSIVPINSSMETEKLKKLMAFEQNKNKKSNALEKQRPALPKEICPRQSVESHYDVPKAILSINPNVKKEQCQQMINKPMMGALELSKEKNPNTFESRKPLPFTPNQICTDKSIDDHYKVPTVVPNPTVNQNMEKDKFEGLITTRDSALPQTLQEKPRTLENRSDLPAKSKKYCSDKSVDNPDMSTNPNKPTTIHPIQEKGKINLDLDAALESNKSVTPLPVTSKDSLCVDSHYAVPAGIPRPIILIDSKVDKKQVKQENQAPIATLESCKEVKPNTLRSQSPLQVHSSTTFYGNIIDDQREVRPNPRVQIKGRLEEEKLNVDINRTLGTTIQQIKTHELGNDIHLPAITKDKIEEDNSSDDQYEVPVIIPNPVVPIKSNLREDKLKDNTTKILDPALQQTTKGKAHILGSHRDLPVIPKDVIEEDNSSDDQYEVPVMVPNSTVPKKSNMEREKLKENINKTLDAALQQTTKEKPYTLENNRHLPIIPTDKIEYDNSSDDQYEVPVMTPNSTVPLKPNMEREKLKENISKTMDAALQQTTQGKPYTLGNHRHLPVIPTDKIEDDNSSDDQYEVPVMIRNSTVPIKPNLEREKLKENISNTLEAALRQTTKEKPYALGNHRHLPVLPKDNIEDDNSSDDQYEVPVTIPNSAAPINSNLGREKFSKTLDAALELNIKGKPSIFGSQRHFPTQSKPKDICMDNNLVEYGYEEPIVRTNSDLAEEKIKAGFSNTLDRALQRNVKGKNQHTLSRQRRPLPALPKEIISDKSVNNNNELQSRDTSQSSRYIDMSKAKITIIEDMENSEYVDMSSVSALKDDTSLDKHVYLHTSPPKIPQRPKKLNLNRPQQPAASGLYTPGISKGTILNLKEPSTGNSPTLNRKPGLKHKLKSANVPTSEDEEIDDYLPPKQTVFPDSESYVNNSPFPLDREVALNHQQKIGRTCPALPKVPSNIVPFTISDEEEHRYETLPDLKSKPPMKGSIQNKPSSRTMDPNPFIKPTTMKKNWNKTRHAANNSHDITDLPPLPPERLEDSDFSNVAHDKGKKQQAMETTKGHDKTKLRHMRPPDIDWTGSMSSVWNLLNKSELPRPPRLNNISKDHIAHLRDFLDDVDTPSSDDELFNPNDYIYYRKTDRTGARRLLQTISNLKSDTFVLRESAKDSYFLGLTIFHEDHYYNLGIYKDTNGKFYGQSLNHKATVKFDTLDTFIDYYKYNPLVLKKRNGRIVELYLKYFLPENIF